MPSPFPGMDPYLESPDLFRDLHNTFVTYLRAEIQKRLPETYVARVGERTWVEARDAYIEPDAIVRHADFAVTTHVTSVATAPVATVPVVVSVVDDEYVEPYLDILQVGDQRLVTAIELLSPSNKRPGERGQALYLQKQTDLLSRSVHLIEIDLLRGGRHTTAVPFRAWSRHSGRVPYHVCIRAFDRPTHAAIYPIPLRRSLPEIAIPLLPGDGDVKADLQAVFNRSYDAGPFRKRVRYDSEIPDPPLAAEDLEWARECIAAVPKS